MSGVNFFVQYSTDGKLLAIGTGFGGTEITEAEYNRLLSEIRDKASLVDQLYSGAITIADVPTEWQEQIQRRVDERIVAEGEADEQELSAEEALDSVLVGMKKAVADGTITVEQYKAITGKDYTE